MVVAVAAASAACYAVAAVLQQRGGAGLGRDDGLRLGLLARLARRPLWQAGVAANVVAYGLQFLALGRGSLTLVQPILVSGFVLALPLAAWWARRPLAGAEWLGAAATLAGLVLFLVAAGPTRGRSTASTAAWLAVGIAVVVAVGGLLAAGRHPSLLALAAGILYGTMAAFTKATAGLAHHGLLRALGHWPPYALAATGIAAVVVVQTAYQAGPLSASLPVLTATEPIVGVLIGLAVLGERVAASGPARVGEAAGLALVGIGMTRLAMVPR
jgi:drug/metabolite transporter (DMT)-like permease